jgi:hypothetical protein
MLAAYGTSVFEFAHDCLKTFHISTRPAIGIFGDFQFRVFMIEFIPHFQKSVSSALFAAL